MRKLGDAMGRGRGDQKQVGTVRKIDMSGLPAFLFRPEVGRGRVPRQRLKCEWRYEPRRIFRQNRKDQRAGFGQPTRQIRSLIGGDGSGNAQYNRAIF